jgi:tight adherence protein B
MIAVIAAGCAFLAVFLAIAGARVRPGFATESERRLGALKQDQVVVESSAVSLIRRAPSSLPFLKTILSGEWGENVRLQLARADIGLRAGEYLALRAALVIIPVAASLVLFGFGIGALIALLVGGLGFVLPIVYLRVRTGRRVDAASAQLAEFLRLTANALRSGSALLQALESASRELQPPLSTELERLLLDSSMGANVEDALRRFADRVGSYEVKAMVTAILIQRTTGGNLAEVLDKVAETVEERERIAGEVRSFTAQQRLTGNVLSVYPLVLALLFTVIHPALMSLLWTDPVGIVLLAIGLSLQLAGFLTIRRILTVDY